MKAAEFVTVLKLKHHLGHIRADGWILRVLPNTVFKRKMLIKKLSIEQHI
jgi:hypothetical protein